MAVLQALLGLILRVLFFGCIAFFGVKFGIAYRTKKDLEGNGK